jgi:isopentenyl phosphate kinase
LSLQPSTTVETATGQVVAWQTTHIQRALEVGLVPVIHGDVSFDRDQGCAIASTEMLLTWLCGVPALQPQRIILVGEAAVFSDDPHRNPAAERIPVIDQQNITQVMGGAGGSHGIDVTGGMASKIALMWRLVQQVPALEVWFVPPDPAIFGAVLAGVTVHAGTVMRY